MAKERFLPVADSTVERRCFLVGCAAVAAGCSGATAALPNDNDAGDDGGTGDEGGTDGGDAASDAMSMCPANARDTGKKPSDFVAGKPVYFQSIIGFVVRDANGLYALTAVCTHQGCTIASSGGGFSCPCHGAGFDINGAVTAGPARTPLKHYALCLSANGTVAVDTRTTVAAATRFSF